MHKFKFLTVIAAVLFTCIANAQAPTDGHIAGKSYVNTYFHFSYSWPATLKPQLLPKQTPAGPNTYAFPLFTARQGDQPYGIMIVAEKLSARGPHSSNVKTSAEFVDRIAHSLRPGPVLSNIARAKKTAHGMVFEELNYLQSGKPSAVIATQMGDYVIVFKCNAQSAPEFAEMEKSALALQKLK